MSDQQRKPVRHVTQEERRNSREMQLSCKAIFDSAVRNYERKLSGKRKMLIAFQDGISDLRSKGASYRDIAQILAQAGVQVSHDTVARFCRSVITKTPRSQKRRRKLTSSSDAPNATASVQPFRVPDKAIDAPPKAVPKAPIKSRGPRIADPKNL